MVNADWHREYEKQDEGDSSHRIAVQPASDRTRNQRVKGDVRRYEPEIDNRVECPGKKHTGQTGIDRRLESQGNRQDLEKDLDGRADGGPGPEVRAGHAGEHRQWNRFATMAPLPCMQVDGHQRHPDPGADDHQNDADVVERIGNHRRIKGIQNGSQSHGYRDHGSHCSQNDEGKPDPGPAKADQRLLECELRDRVTESHRDQGRKHISHRRTVRRDRPIVQVGIADPRVQWATNVHLPLAEDGSDQEGDESHPEMRQHETFAMEHSSVSARCPLV